MMAQIGILLSCMWTILFLKAKDKYLISICAIVPVSIIKLTDIIIVQSDNNFVQFIFSGAAFIFFFFGFVIEEFIKLISSRKLLYYRDFVCAVSLIIFVEIFMKTSSFFDNYGQYTTKYFIAGLASSSLMHAFTASLLWYWRKLEKFFAKFVLFFCCVLIHYFFNAFSETVWIYHRLLFYIFMFTSLSIVIFVSKYRSFDYQYVDPER